MTELYVARQSVPSGPPDWVLPLRAMAFEFRFTQRTLAGPYHGPGLMGFFKSTLGKALSPAVWLATPDNGVPLFNIGDRYRVVVYSLKSGSADLDHILKRLQKTQPARSAQDARAFGPRWRFVAARDALAEDSPRVGQFADLQPLGIDQIESEARIWAEADAVWMRLLSPLQLLREKGQRPEKGMARFCQGAQDLKPDLLLNRLRQGVDSLGRRLGYSGSLPAPDACLQLTAQDLFWHGSEQVGTDHSEKPVYGLGGVLGLSIEGADANTVWQWLTLGQHLGIGQRRGFGLGRYRLEGPSGEQIGNLPERQATLLSASTELANLDAAWDVIRNNKRRAAFERELDRVNFGLPPDADHRSALVDLARDLAADAYEVPAQEGVIIHKPSGGQRALAIPPLLDRVLQRAVAQLLSRIIEPVMYAQSYGYRSGRNRMQARDRIQQLVRGGYEWFFESDIDSFFDAVDHALIYNRLMSLLPDDPVIDRIMRWITAPVRYQGRLLQRGGLPQGSPLSPLLANLVLDDFDHDLVAAGFRPVRFADDFVVPCRTRADAERAAEVVSASLSEKGLALNQDQSRIARFSDGLKFLGYRFVNDLAVESIKVRCPKKDAEPPHSSSWLANIDELQQSKSVSEEGDASSERPAEKAGEMSLRPTEDDEATAPSDAVGEAEQSGTLIIVSAPGSLLFTREGRLWCQRSDEPAAYLAPWSEIGGLLLLGYQRFTQAVLHRAMKHRVAIYFTDGWGRLKGVLHGRPDPTHRDLWLAQLQAAKGTEFCLSVAREIVISRLHHQVQVLRRRGLSSASLIKLGRRQHDAAKSSTLASLRGVEGSATREYFQHLQTRLPTWVGFSGRNRRPPRDPFNALLSLGYTLLYSHADTLLQVAGLLPEYGFYHQPRGRHSALASDLMESFRHLVESVALAQLNRRQLRDADFVVGPESGCRLTDRGRRVFLVGLSERLASAMTDTEERSMTGHQYLYQQSTDLAAAIRDHQVNFRAIRLK